MKRGPGKAAADYLDAIRSTPGMTTKEICERFGVTRNSAAHPLVILFEKGQIERKRVDSLGTHRWYIAGEAPEVAPPVKRDPPLKPAQDCYMELLRSHSASGMLVSEIMAATGFLESSVSTQLARLHKAGKIAWVRDGAKGKGHQRKRWYVAGLEPVAPVEPVKRRLTSIRDANVTMPQGDPIITPTTKITRVDPVPGRFEFKPPPGWRGAITTDWLERRLGAQR
jgi:DNA-binding MarR family transcriptional regulator